MGQPNMLPLSIQTSEDSHHRVDAISRFYVNVDPVAGIVIPSSANLPNGTIINIIDIDPSNDEDLQIAQSSSLETPCIQIAPEKRTFVKLSEGWLPRMPSCERPWLRSQVQIQYIGDEPLMIYSVGGCQRGMVFSVNLPPEDVPVFSENAKSAPKEESPDLSYHGWPNMIPPWCRPRISGPTGNQHSTEAIIVLTAGVASLLVSVLAVLVVWRKRCQLKSKEVEETVPFMKDVDGH